MEPGEIYLADFPEAGPHPVIVVSREELTLATLNLKNFPDALYEHLRAQARRERRSVAQEVIHLLAQAVEPATVRSIMELQGLGKECWQGVDPVAYVRAERDSWDS